MQRRGRADITLKDHKGKSILFIELKDPTAPDGKTIFNSNILLREIGRAQKLQIQYFGVCNFVSYALIDKDNVAERNAISDAQISLKDILNLSQNYTIRADFEKKLVKIASFYIERAIEIITQKTIHFTPIDEVFIYKIKKLIELYSFDITEKIWERHQQDRKFQQRINAYSTLQGWNSVVTQNEIENITHIAILMLVAKLIFYKTYCDNNTFHGLSPIAIPEIDLKPNILKDTIWAYFEDFKEVTHDFELLIGEKNDIIFEIPFESPSIVDLLKNVVETGKYYDFSTIAYDVIGRIFEDLIREDERHKLGQYFTPPVVIDFINAFCIRTGKEKVMDPSCGSGTFLVRAYQRKKELQPQIPHFQLLEEVYGSDISHYAVYLAILNLAIRNMTKTSYPRILHKDFFKINVGKKERFYDKTGKTIQQQVPMLDAVIGNPPYTRQEDINAFNSKTKNTIFTIIAKEWGIQPSQRTSIYAHFFYHAGFFLKEQGWLGFVVQNSWMDTDYGQDLQQWMLKHFKVVAIVESEVERFFPSAEVNTNIVLLQRESNATERNKNQAKFVYLKQKLQQILDIEKGEDAFRTLIENLTSSIENEQYRITCIPQSDLATQNKWSVFHKAPKVYWQILEKGGNKWKKLKEVAEVKFGIKTGCNEFFLLKDLTDTAEDALIQTAMNLKPTQKHSIPKTLAALKAAKLCLVKSGFEEVWLIEEDLLFPILTSPKDSAFYVLDLDKISYRIFITAQNKEELSLHFPYAWKYIQDGESKDIHKRHSCAARNLWYNVGAKQVPDMAFNYMINDVGRTFLGKCYTNNNFHNVFVKHPNQSNNLFLYLNSTIYWLLQLLTIRTNMGGGVAKIETYEFADLPIIEMDFSATNIHLSQTISYKAALGSASALSSDFLEIEGDRLALDKAVLTAIGFEEGEIAEVLADLYAAVRHLIAARLEKSKSTQTTSKHSERGKISADMYADLLEKEIKEADVTVSNTLAFEKELKKLSKNITSDTKLQNKMIDAYWQSQFGEPFNKINIIKKEQGDLFS